MKAATISVLDSIVNNSYLNLGFGLFFLACGVNEIYQQMEEDFSLQAHHGMVVFGIAHTFKSLSMLLKGLR